MTPDDRAASADALQRAFVEVLAVERRHRARTPGPDLSVAQFRGLIRLSEAGEMTAGDLAKAAEVTASVTGMLDTLERAGIVERRRSTEDRRRVVVSMTDEGHALVERKRAWWARLWATTLEGLTDEEIATGARVLDRLVAALAATDPDEPLGADETA